MQNSDPQNRNGVTPPVETNYEEHQDHPGPSKEAVVEEDKNGASRVLRWIIPVLVVVLLIVWFFFKG